MAEELPTEENLFELAEDGLTNGIYLSEVDPKLKEFYKIYILKRINDGCKNLETLIDE